MTLFKSSIVEIIQNYLSFAVSFAAIGQQCLNSNVVNAGISLNNKKNQNFLKFSLRKVKCSIICYRIDRLHVKCILSSEEENLGVLYSPQKALIHDHFGMLSLWKASAKISDCTKLYLVTSFKWIQNKKMVFGK